MTVTYYQAYGLALASELPLPGIPLPNPPAGCPLVHIHYGHAPPLEQPAFSGVLYQASRQGFRLEMPGVAAYLVRNGDEILVEPAVGADPAEAAYFLQGSPLAALLIQRGDLVLHASAIRTSHGAVLFAGDSSSGKSVLAAASLQKGFQLVSDELSVLRPGSEGKLYIYPGFPLVQLWPDALQTLNLTTQAIPPIRAGQTKCPVPFLDEFLIEPLLVRHVIIIQAHNQQSNCLEILTGRASFEHLASLTYLSRSTQAFGLHGQQFALLGSLIKQAKLQKVLRCDQLSRLDDLLDLIVRDE